MCTQCSVNPLLGKKHLQGQARVFEQGEKEKSGAIEESVESDGLINGTTRFVETGSNQADKE